MQTCVHQCQCDWLRLQTCPCSQESRLLLADRMQNFPTEGAVTGCWVIFKWQWCTTGSAQTSTHCFLGNWSVRTVGLDNVLVGCCGWESGGGKQTCTPWWSWVKVVCHSHSIIRVQVFSENVLHQSVKEYRMMTMFYRNVAAVDLFKHLTLLIWGGLEKVQKDDELANPAHSCLLWPRQYTEVFHLISGSS